MKRLLCTAAIFMLAAACTTKFKDSDEDGDLDGQDLTGDELDAAVDGQDPVPDGTDAPDTPDGTGCDEGEIDCTGVCVNPMEDRNNCGNCGIACNDMEECVEGTCRCRMGLELCGDECVNLMVDNRHCGACDEPCPADAECTDGDCICVTGLTMCDDHCVNTNTNNEHCGRCNNPCTEPLMCNGSGECSLECGSGFTVCPGPPAYCADLDSDPMNCNACGHACPEPPDNARAVCEEGICWWQCLTDWYDANGMEADGCECHYEGTEVCNGLDDDCINGPDDTFPCVRAARQNCTLSGSCTGISLCNATCNWDPCENTAWMCAPGEVDNTCHPPMSDLCPGTRSCASNCLGWDECLETCAGADPDCCSTGCTNRTIDPDNCGTCGRSCSSGLYCCDSDCHECCMSSQCEPQCRGTATACSDLSDPSNCDQVGCSWTTNMGCGGTPGSCSNYNGSALTCSACGCTYSDPNCSGTPSPCDAFANQGPCESCGCGWMNITTCEGTPRPCDGFTSQVECRNQEGCSWYECTGNNCVPT